MGVVIHPTAVVSPAAELGDGVKIGPYCIVEGRSVIGAGTTLKAFVSVNDFVTIGENCRIYEYTAIGGEPQDNGYKGEESWVRVGNNNVIRENVTIHRSSGEGSCTSVGDDCFIMEGVHVAHNVKLGNHVTIANKVGLSGHVTVGDHTVFGGMAGVHQFVRIGNYCMIAGMYRFTKDIPHYTLASGEPVRLTGLNAVGLKRANFSVETRRAIRTFYGKLYGKGRLFSKALQEALENKAAYIPEVQRILEFYEGTRRGVTFWGKSSGEPE